jgi:1-acyl-sn-glycerol-3-phosphate acyltransferase
MLQSLSLSLLSLFGWNLEKKIPEDNKILIIGAPHTSNWDFPLTLLAMSALGLRFSWIGKHTLFRGPIGMLYRKIGGIPVNRKASSGFIHQIVQSFATRDVLRLAIAPEGTRSKEDHWKAGFYRIAVQADIKICLGFIDYTTKTIGLGPTLMPSKNIVADFELIKEFYKEKAGKHPHKKSTIRLREKEILHLEKEYNQPAMFQEDDTEPKK